MRKITQAEFDAFPIIDGVRRCPGQTDYSLVGSFGPGASFGEGASFGAGCKLENTKPIIGSAVYSFGGFGRENRTTYMIPTKSGIFVRCGCWSGLIWAFRERVVEVHGDSAIAAEYLAICDVAEIRWKRELSTLGAGEVE